MRALMPADHRMGDRLHTDAYSEPALIPESPWLGGQAPHRPTVEIVDANGSLKASFFVQTGPDVWIWAVRTLVGGRWIVAFVPGNDSQVQLPRGYGNRPPEAVAVSGVDRTGLEGPVTVVRLPGSNSMRRGW